MTSPYDTIETTFYDFFCLFFFRLDCHSGIQCISALIINATVAFLCPKLAVSFASLAIGISFSSTFLTNFFGLC